jgi:GT2 family glycosyltransferase
MNAEPLAISKLDSAEGALRRSPVVSIVIVNTNELHHLRRCLPAIDRQAYPNYRVLLIDNNSTDGSLEWVRLNHPGVQIVENGRNLGYAGANNVGFQHAAGDYVAVLNPDTEVAADWLDLLVEVCESDSTIGLATPQVLHMDRPAAVNACGNDVTYTGLTFCRGLDQPAEDFEQVEDVPAVSGAAFVIRKSVLDQIGGFDESFFVYYEDTDLSLRAQLAGYRCVCVPAAKVLHKYVFKLSPRKCFYQERNRYYALLKLLRWPTLLAMLPGLLISEVLVWGYLLMRGPSFLLAKLSSYASLLRCFPRLLADRRRVQKLRRVGDRALVRSFGSRLTLAQTSTSEISNPGSMASNVGQRRSLRSA